MSWPNMTRLNVAVRGARTHIWFPCCYIYPMLFWTSSVISAPSAACILSSPLRPGLCEKPGRRENDQTGHSSIREVGLLPMVHVARERGGWFFWMWALLPGLAVIHKDLAKCYFLYILPFHNSLSEFPSSAGRFGETHLSAHSKRLLNVLVYFWFMLYNFFLTVSLFVKVSSPVNYSLPLICNL